MIRNAEVEITPLIQDLLGLLIDLSGDLEDVGTLENLGVVLGCEEVGVDLSAKLRRKVEKAERIGLNARWDRGHSGPRCSCF